MTLVSSARWHVRIAGGLGNQLFQYGTALLLARRFGGEIFLTDHTQKYQAARNLTLGIAASLPYTLPSKWARIGNSMRLGRLPLPWCVNDQTIEKFLSPEGSTRDVGDRYFVDGYFQDCWNNATIHELISAVRAVSHPAEDGDHVALHIRGGDFLRLPKYQVISPEFYRHALQRLSEMLPQQELVVEVITDDDSFARSALESASIPRVRLKYNKSAGISQDFQRLRTARARIIGNSTFSWWAAALASPAGITLSCPNWTTQRTRNYMLPGEIHI